MYEKEIKKTLLLGGYLDYNLIEKVLRPFYGVTLSYYVNDKIQIPITINEVNIVNNEIEVEYSLHKQNNPIILSNSIKEMKNISKCMKYLVDAFYKNRKFNNKRLKGGKGILVNDHTFISFNVVELLNSILG